MASFLQMPNKTNQGPKFIRAVKSFLNQTHENKELFIVADGCQLSMQIYHENFTQYPNIKIIPIPKQPPYSGEMRNVAFQYCSGDIVTFLDADDVLKKGHLQYIHDNFNLNELDWIYYNDEMTLNKEFTKLYTRIVEPRYGSIGTSSISIKNPRLLKNGSSIRFPNGYGHDFLFCLKLNSLGLRFKKIEETSGYIVCHYLNMDA